MWCRSDNRGGPIFYKIRKGHPDMSEQKKLENSKKITKICLVTVTVLFTFSSLALSKTAKPLILIFGSISIKPLRNATAEKAHKTTATDTKILIPFFMRLVFVTKKEFTAKRLKIYNFTFCWVQKRGELLYFFVAIL